MSDDEFHAFELPIPPGLVDYLTRLQTKAAMESEDRGKTIEQLIVELSIPQLLAFRKALHLRRTGLTHLDGQIYSLLRLVHCVDPATGLTAEEALMQMVEKGGSDGIA